MKLTVYGNNATCPEKDGACSSFLLETNESKILIDMGSGCLGKIQRDIDVKDIDMIIISHLHFDHVADLFCAKYMLETRKAKGEKIKTIKLLTPLLPQWASKELLTNNVFDYTKITTNLSIKFKDVSLKFKEMIHLIESYAVRIENDEKAFVYTGDTGFFPGIETIAINADLLLSEATFTSKEKEEEDHHLSSYSAALIAQKAHVKKLLLTHYHSKNKDIIFQEAKEIFKDAELSKIGESYSI